MIFQWKPTRQQPKVQVSTIGPNQFRRIPSCHGLLEQDQNSRVVRMNRFAITDDPVKLFHKLERISQQLIILDGNAMERHFFVAKFLLPYRPSSHKVPHPMDWNAFVTWIRQVHWQVSRTWTVGEESKARHISRSSARLHLGHSLLLWCTQWQWVDNVLPKDKCLSRLFFCLIKRYKIVQRSFAFNGFPVTHLVLIKLLHTASISSKSSLSTLFRLTWTSSWCNSSCIKWPAVCATRCFIAAVKTLKRKLKMKENCYVWMWLRPTGGKTLSTKTMFLQF